MESHQLPWLPYWVVIGITLEICAEVFLLSCKAPCSYMIISPVGLWPRKLLWRGRSLVRIDGPEGWPLFRRVLMMGREKEIWKRKKEGSRRCQREGTGGWGLRPQKLNESTFELLQFWQLKSCSEGLNQYVLQIWLLRFSANLVENWFHTPLGFSPGLVPDPNFCSCGMALGQKQQNPVRCIS